MVELNQEVDTNEAPVNVDVDTERQQPQERRSVRESLEKTFQDAHKEDQRTSRRDTKRDTNRRDQDGKFVAPEGEETEQTEPKEPEQQVTETQPPASWSKQAKETWGTLPQQVQAEVTKREKDMERGVSELKAKYNELDQALAPHVEAIKRFNKTPAQAVSQLFAWFQALAQNPDEAIPALVKSYNYPPEKLMAAFGIQPQVKEAVKEEVQPEGDIPPAVQQYITKLEEKINGFTTQVGQQIDWQQKQFAEQSMAKTHETLNMWAKDRPFFEEVRTLMGHFLTPDPNTGVAAVPLKDGKVDLDTAYEMAIYANPAVRAKVQAEESAKLEKERQAKLSAEAKAQKEQTDKAKRASGSLNSSAPGAEVSRKGNVPKGKSVRQSIMDAREELSS